jgi:hypothetical protein
MGGAVPLPLYVFVDWTGENFTCSPQYHLSNMQYFFKQEAQFRVHYTQTFVLFTLSVSAPCVCNYFQCLCTLICFFCSAQEWRKCRWRSDVTSLLFVWVLAACRPGTSSVFRIQSDWTDPTEIWGWCLNCYNTFQQVINNLLNYWNQYRYNDSTHYNDVATGCVIDVGVGTSSSTTVQDRP